MHAFGSSRRDMLKGAAGVTVASVLAHFPGARLIRAQGDAEYEVIALVQQTGVFKGGANEGWPDAEVYGLNADGDTCGYIAASEERPSPAVWSLAGELQRLESGKFGGHARALNANGLVVGLEYKGVSFGADRRAYAWLDGERIDLHAQISDSTTASYASAVNNLNQVLVFGDLASYLFTVESVDEVTVVTTDLAYRLGPDGQLLFIDTTTGSGVATFEAGLLDDLRTIEVELPEGAAFLWPEAINASGTIVAAIGDADYNTIATVLIEGDEQTLFDLRADGEQLNCWSLNAAGVMAGIRTNEARESTAVIVVDGEIIDLNERVPDDLGVRLGQAWGINDQGAILASGAVDELKHHFLLIPAK